MKSIFAFALSLLISVPSLSGESSNKERADALERQLEKKTSLLFSVNSNIDDKTRVRILTTLIAESKKFEGKGFRQIHVQSQYPTWGGFEPTNERLVVDIDPDASGEEIIRHLAEQKDKDEPEIVYWANMLMEIRKKENLVEQKYRVSWDNMSNIETIEGLDKLIAINGSSTKLSACIKHVHMCDEMAPVSENGTVLVDRRASPSAIARHLGSQVAAGR